jgi:hypothetical protein
MSARRPGRMLLLAMVALILAALAPVPASADHAPPPGDLAGSGEVHGTEIVQEEAFTGSLCLRATKTVFGLRGVGTYYGRTAGGQDVVYKAELSGPSQTLYGDGPVRLELENTETYYHGPYGTHGTSDASCAPATAGGAVPAEFRIFAPEHIYRLDGTGAQGPCKGQGTFTRGGGTAEASRWHADWTLTDDCTVVGNAAGTPGSGVTRAGTAMTHHGSHEPCFSPPCPDNLQIDYKQYPPAVGLHVSLSGPTSVTVGGAATVTARVTNDGVAVPNATVTFAVTGAGPATPPAGTALTGADGRATFTFTAAVAGTYTVTASTTSGGTTASSTFAVQFSPPPPPTLTMDGPTRAQTEESITVGATFTSSGNALPGVTVNFAVTGAGQSTPATGSATTDANGRAAFTFAANRAGEYTVNASATHLGQATSAAHVLRLDIRTFQRVGALTLPEGDTLGSAAVVDPGGKYAYFGDFESVVKIDLDTFQRVGAVTLPPATGEWDLASAVIDPAGRYAYFGTRALSQAKVIKIDLATFQRVDAITLNPGEEVLDAAVIDPAGAYAYFATAGPNNDPEVSRSRVVKIDLATFQRVGALTFSTGETEVHAAVIDAAGTYAYFAARGAGNSPAAVVKVDLRTFQRVGAAILNGAAERDVLSAVIDPGGAFAYFGTTHTATDPTRVVKVDLTTFQRAGALIVGNGSEDLVTAVIDPVGHFAYFGTETPGSGLSDPADRVLKLDLSAFERVGAITLPPEEKNVKSAVIDPDGTHVYFGSAGWGTISFPTPPSKVVKIAVSRPPSAWLVATSDSYSPPYASPLSVAAPGVLANDDDTQDNDPLSASLVRPPAHGDVTLNANGSFSYTPDSGFSGTDTFTYSFDDAMNVSAPATVSITVGAAPQGVQAVSGGAFGFETNVSLFGGPASVKGGAGSTCGQAGQPVCADGQSPAVSLPASGGQLTATDPDGNIGQYGPAYIFENHGPLTASAQGSTGPSGSVTATAAVDKVEDNDPFHAGSPDGGVSSTCTAGQSVLSGLTRIVNGRLVTSTDPTTGDVATEVTFPHD